MTRRRPRLTSTADENKLEAVFSPRLDANLWITVSQVRLCWDTETASVYQLQYRSGLTADEWVNLCPEVVGTSTVACAVDDVTSERRFYRVIEVR